MEESIWFFCIVNELLIRSSAKPWYIALQIYKMNCSAYLEVFLTIPGPVN